MMHHGPSLARPFGDSYYVHVNKVRNKYGGSDCSTLPLASYICSAKSPSVRYFHSFEEHGLIKSIGYKGSIHNMPVATKGTLTLGPGWFTGDFRTPDEQFSVHVDGTFTPLIPEGLQTPIPVLTYTSLSEPDFDLLYQFSSPASFVGQAAINILCISTSGTQFIISSPLVPPLPNSSPIPINGTARFILS